MVVLFDQFNLPESIYDIIFATEQQSVVARLLIHNLKLNSGQMSKTEMSLFATRLHDGDMTVTVSGPAMTRKEIKLSYNKRQFYDRILTPMKSMGLIDYDLYEKNYKISDKFNKMMIKIGLLWLREIR